jgi:aryl-alcohol dehydrogenase-like predicted oxidoreductase
MPPPNQIKTTPRSKLISGDFMHQRQLGKSGPKLSAIGIGAMSFTDFYGATSEAASHAVLTNALDLGVNHIDTANVYGGGLSESVIGRFLAKQGAQKTKLFHIATKAGIAVDKETGRRYFDNSPAYLQAELDASLARLGLDYVDLYYIHRRDSETPIEEVTETLAAMVKAGKIGGFGFSEIAPTSLYRAAAIHEIAAVQSEYSLSVRSPEMGLGTGNGCAWRVIGGLFTIGPIIADRQAAFACHSVGK